MDGLAHYGDPYWHGIFEDAPYRTAALRLLEGSTLVTDLDFTAYRQDAGFGLLDAAIHTGLLSHSRAAEYRALHAAYDQRSVAPTLEGRKEQELQFYQATLRIFAGLRLADVRALSQQMWKQGISGLFGGVAFQDTIYPEMAYLYALAAQNAKSQAQGLLAVTASPFFAVEPAFPLLHLRTETTQSMDLVVGADGVLTEAISRVIHGAGKVRAARNVFPTWEFASGDNPRNDYDFLAAATHTAFGIGEEVEILRQDLSLFKSLPVLSPPKLTT